MLSEEQLRTWSRQANPTYAYETLDVIRRILKAGYPLRERKFEVYMQGCYKNDTNTTSYEEADIVVQLNQTFHADLQSLTQAEQVLYWDNYVDTSYGYGDFWFDILKVLNRLTSGSTITYGYKSVKYYNPENGLTVNLRVAMQFRKYQYFYDLKHEKYLEGITFYAHHEGDWATSYPKLHYTRCAVKNLAGQTNGWYLPTVRMFKNARNKLVERGKIASGSASSYFIECLLYNVPNDMYGVNHQTTFKKVAEWLRKSDMAPFMVQSGPEPLFGRGPSQWRLEGANEFLDGLSEFL